LSTCQVAECGAPADGRCRQCGRAICAGHRFAGRSDTMSSHLCTECAQLEAQLRSETEQERRLALAQISAIATALVADGRPPTRAIAWTRQIERRWWAFAGLGRYTVETPIRLGWPVGEFPWEGPVSQRQGTTSKEVFMVPTFVDAEGEVVPLHALRASPLDNHLLTGEMCRQIVDAMEAIAARARE
jgi:hypothetical protein